MTKKNLFLHIGTPKTGTTAIQNFCLLNNEKLHTNKFHYFTSALYNDHSHHLLSFLLWDKEGFNIPELKDISLDDMLLKMVREMEELPSSINNYILSSEVLLEVVSLDTVKSLKKFIHKNFDSVKIICYVRRQDHYFQSVYLEWMKSNFENVRYKSIPEFITEFKGNYYRLIKPWSDLFGKENIVVRAYEKEQFVEKNIFNDFFNILGINIDSTYTLPPKAYTNYSINEFAYAILKAYPTIDFEVLIKLGIDLYKSNSSDFDLLTPDERDSIFEKFDKSNEQLAKEFLNRKDGKLFYEPKPDSSQQQNNSISHTNEKLISLFIDKIINQNDLINTLKNSEKVLLQKVEHINIQLNYIQKENTQTISQLKNKLILHQKQHTEILEQKQHIINLIQNQSNMLNQLALDKKNMDSNIDEYHKIIIGNKEI